MCVCCKCELCVGMSAVHVCVVFSVSLFLCVMVSAGAEHSEIPVSSAQG